MISQHWKAYSIFFFFFLGLLHVGGRQSNAAAQPLAPGSIKRSSSAISLTTDGAILLTVNPDSNSITLIDTITQIVIKEIPVGTDPRAIAVDDLGARAYVANRVSNSISVIDLATNEQVDEVGVGYHPYGIVLSPEGDRLYITEQGNDSLRCLDTTTLETITQIELGDRPSGAAISSDGNVLYVTHLFSNQVSVIDLNAELIFLPILLRSNSTAHQQTQIGTSQKSRATSSYDPVSPISLWPDSNLVQSIILSPDGQFAYIPHTRSNTSNQALTFDTTVFPLVSMIDLNTNTHLIGQQLDLGTLDPPGVGIPFDAAVTPDGKEIWILNAASNDITAINLSMRQLAAHIEVDDNPRGIVLSPDGNTAYVNNTLAGTVSVIDTTAYTVTNVITTTQIPMPPLLLRGVQPQAHGWKDCVRTEFALKPKARL